MDDTEVTPEKGIDQSDVLEKYKAAGAIVEQALDIIRRAAYAGMVVGTVCQLGDTYIAKQCARVFSKARTESGEKLEKGVAFPTCICINNCACHFCPIETDPGSSITLKENDIFTVQLGAHIDGYAAISSNTIAVRPAKDSPTPPIKGTSGQAVKAAYTAAEAALRLMRPGKSNYAISEMIEKVANDMDVNALEGVLSHQMKRYIVDGSKVILNKQSLDQKAEHWEFENYEVYNLDIVMSTGEGKAIERDTRETIYKRQVDVDYKLKMKTSRQVFSEINKSYPTMPFTLRALNDPKRSRMAMTEIVKHSLVTSYPVLYEKDDAVIARCCLTVLITPTQTMVVTKSVMPDVECDKEITDESIKTLLATSIAKKKKKKNKNKPSGDEVAAAPAAAGAGGDAMET